MRDKEQIARTETLDTGKTLGESRIDVDDVTAVFRYYADLADKDAGRLVDTGQPNVLSRVVHEPVGVCVLITPWNYPLLQLSWKVAPALAAGNTCVIKPSEVTPLTSVLLVRLLEEAGVPPGVVNIVLGDGRSVGAPLTEHDGRRHGQLHRRAGHRAGHHPGVRGHREAGRRGAGRQEPQRRVRRHRLRDRGGQRADRGLPALRPGLLGRGPADRAERAGRRAGRRGRPGGPSGSGWATGSTRASRSARWSPPRTGRRSSPIVASALEEGAQLAGRRPPPGRAGAAEGLLLPAHRARRLPRRDAGGPRGDVRADPDRRAVRHRGRGGRAGQRHRVRPGRCRVHHRRRAGAPGGRRAALRHGLDQRLPPVHPRGGVGRDEALRQRPGAGPHRAGRVPGGEAHMAQHRTCARSAGSPDDRPGRR